MSDERPDDGQPQGPIRLTPEQARARRKRNVAIGVTIALFMLFFYIITVAKLGVGVLNRPL